MKVDDFKVGYITVRIKFQNTGSLDDIAENCDYNFIHKDIVDTEILECEEKKNENQ
jgi:hypothetical protein